MKKHNIYTYLLLFLMIITFVLSVKVTRRATNLMVEGDASAEMVLSHSLSKTHEILSHDWIYGAELRVVHTQLVYSLLFNYFDDWGRVRFYGTVFMHSLLILSFTFMMKQAKHSWNAIFLGCAMIIMPFNVVYGRIVLYQTFYLPNIIFGFLSIGLLFSAIRCIEKSNTLLYGLSLFILCVISFLSGLNGVRFIADIILPVLLISFLYIILKNSFDIGQNKIKSILYYIALFLMTISGLFGFFVNKGILSKQYTYSAFSDRMLTYRTYFEPSIMKCVLHQFGFKTNVPLFSFIGFSSLAGLLVVIFCIFCSFIPFTSKRKNISIDVFLFRKMMITVFICIITEMYLLGGLEITPRYFISASIWMIPLLCSYSDEFSNTKIKTPRSIIYLICLIIIICNGVLNMSFFLNPDGIAKQPYEGLPYTNPNMIRDLKRSLEFIEKNEYQFGYAPYWEATTITEKTNGLPVGGFTVEGDKIVPAQVLTLRSYDTLPADKVFLLLDVTNAQYFPDFDVSFEWSEVYRDIHYVIYDIPNLEHMREYLSQQN